MDEKRLIRATARAAGYDDVLIRIRQTGIVRYYIVEALGQGQWATGPVDRVLAQIREWPALG